MHNKEDNLALKDKQSVPKGRRPLLILNTNFSNKGNKFTNALGDYARIATFSTNFPEGEIGSVYWNFIKKKKKKCCQPKQPNFGAS